MDEEKELKPVEDMQEFCQLRATGQRVWIAEELFDYFLECLPPVAMSTAVKMPDGRMQSTAFLFAEGAEFCTAFWTEGRGAARRHVAQLTGIMNPHA